MKKEIFGEVRQMMDQIVQGDDDLAKWVGQSRVIQNVTRLPGDASTRRYYRIEAEGSQAILMKMDAFASEGLNLPFLVVQKHLEQAKVRVPKVLDLDPTKGFILLEDLGDITLLRHLQGVSSPDVERHLYEQVIDMLVEMQAHCGPEKSTTKLDAFGLRFDHAKLMWEMEFMIEHFYLGYLKRTMPAQDLQIMREGLSEICMTLDKEPTVFTHRDFHSRNVMVSGKDFELVMIDFQDARMGPSQYDLASLLRDSYYQLEEAQIDRLIDYYIARYEAATQQKLDRTHYKMIFDLMSVQRNLKAIGSFASFMVKRGEPGYLKYIGNTFENVRKNLLKYPKYSKLREVLFHYYYF